MKNRRNLNAIDCMPRSNPVARHAHRFNKAQVFKDKKLYRRKAKHAIQEAFPKAVVSVFGNAFYSDSSNVVTNVTD